jgi:hypothetical protein
LRIYFLRRYFFRRYFFRRYFFRRYFFVVFSIWSTLTKTSTSRDDLIQLLTLLWWSTSGVILGALLHKQGLMVWAH